MANLIFSDEFNGTTLDSNKWTRKNNWQHSASPTCMLAENVYVSNGNLVLKSRNEGGSPCSAQTSSGYLDSKGKFSFKYGYAEIRARLPKGKGIWPAFWLLPASGGWPPEIDVFEMLGHQPSKLYMTVHAPGCNDPNCGGYSCCKTGSYTGPDYSADYHTYAIDWTANYIKWYIDGVERFSSTQYVPQEPMFLVFDTFIGGDWPGYPDSTTQFPQYYYVDYIRVYDSVPTPTITPTPPTITPTPPTITPTPPTITPTPPTITPTPPTITPTPPTITPTPPTITPTPTGKYKCLPVIDWTIPAITMKCVEDPKGALTESLCKRACKGLLKLDGAGSEINLSDIAHMNEEEKYLYMTPGESWPTWAKVVGVVGAGAVIYLLIRKR